MLDRLGDELFGDRLGAGGGPAHRARPRARVDNGTATLRIRVPFGERGDVGLKKVGPELIVSVGPRKRTIILPTALARRRPTGAKLEDGTLEVSFENSATADAHA